MNCLCYDIYDKDLRNLNKFKQSALSQLYPSQSPLSNCTMLLASNLAYPEWININCDETILTHVVCFVRDGTNRTVNASINPMKKIASEMIFLKMTSATCWFGFIDPRLVLQNYFILVQNTTCPHLK